MDELTPMMIKDWLSEEAKRPGHKPGTTVSGYTLHGMLRVVRTLTKDAQTDLRLPFWPCERVKCPKPLTEYLDDENTLSPEELGTRVSRRFTPHGCHRTLNTLAMKIAPAEPVRKVIGHNTAGMTERYLAAGLAEKRQLVEGVAYLVRAAGGDRGGDPTAPPS